MQAWNVRVAVDLITDSISSSSQHSAYTCSKDLGLLNNVDKAPAVSSLDSMLCIACCPD